MMTDIIVSTESLDLNNDNDSTDVNNKVDFDNKEEDSDERRCGICTEEFNRDEEDYLKLDCGHEYHYTCISDCFSSIVTMKVVTSTNNKRECPYCRKISKLLPIKMGVHPIKSVHQYVPKAPSNYLTDSRCLAICKTGKKCKNKGKSEHSGYCGIHKNLMNS